MLNICFMWYFTNVYCKYWLNTSSRLSIKWIQSINPIYVVVYIIYVCTRRGQYFVYKIPIYTNANPPEIGLNAIFNFK